MLSSTLRPPPEVSMREFDTQSEFCACTLRGARVERYIHPKTTQIQIAVTTSAKLRLIEHTRPFTCCS